MLSHGYTAVNVVSSAPVRVGERVDGEHVRGAEVGVIVVGWAVGFTECGVLVFGEAVKGCPEKGCLVMGDVDGETELGAPVDPNVGGTEGFLVSGLGLYITGEQQRIESNFPYVGK